MAAKTELAHGKEFKHYHACEWCGLLEACEYQSCVIEAGDDWDEDGTLPGGHCDRTCYDHKRPQGIHRGTTENGFHVTLPINRPSTISREQLLTAMAKDKDLSTRRLRK